MIDKDTMVRQIEGLMDKYASESAMPDVPTGAMTREEFMDIVECWSLSSGFLERILGKSKHTIASYKYRDGHIPEQVAMRMRRLAGILESYFQTPLSER